jgi:hypothetical protein
MLSRWFACLPSLSPVVLHHLINYLERLGISYQSLWAARRRLGIPPPNGVPPMPTSSAFLTPGYSKWGDDFASALEQSKQNPAAALLAWAASLEATAAGLRKAAAIVRGHAVEMTGDTHVVTIDGPEDVIDRLVSDGLAEADEFDPEGDEDFGEGN